MTSPTQFNYLQAMGIPVWVSRDLVVDVDEVNINTDELLDKDKEPCPDSAQDVLQSLTQQPAQSDVVESKAETAETSQPALVASLKDDFSQQIGKTSLHWLFATGNPSASWMVVGQSPDRHESPANQPYPHDTGELLSNMLRAVGLQQPREDAYLLNVVHAPVKTTPSVEEEATRALYQQLVKIIKQVNPEILLIVGQLAAQNLLQTKEPLARIRAKQFQDENIVRLPGSEIPVVTTYYPSYLINKPQDKGKAWQDLKLAMRILQA